MGMFDLSIPTQYKMALCGVEGMLQRFHRIVDMENQRLRWIIIHFIISGSGQL